MNDQLELQPVARASDPDTSWEAARSVGNLRESQAAVLVVLRDLVFGATDEELSRRYFAKARASELKPQSPSGLRTRRRELVDLGLVVDTGERRAMSTGRNAIVWGAV